MVKKRNFPSKYQNSSEALTERSGIRAKTVLLVDWRAEVLQKLASVFWDCDIQIETSLSLESALIILEEKHAQIDLVVVESFFNSGNVYRFLGTLRSRDELKTIPLLMLATETGEVGRNCIETVGNSLKFMGACEFIEINDNFEQVKLAVVSMIE